MNQGHDSSVTPKKAPPAERESKMTALRTSLPGLLIEGPLEPGHIVLNHCAAMGHANECRYLSPEQCVSRTHEVLHRKSPTKQLDISASSLVVKEANDIPDMTATSALQVQEALTRRGVALAFADLVTYSNYSRYLTSLFAHLHHDPPPGHSRCTVSQLVAADRMVWQILVEGDVKPKRDAAGKLALDAKLITILQGYRVSFTLLPLPAKKNESQPSQKKERPPAHQGKGAAKVIQSWSKPQGQGKKGGKTKMRVPPHIYKLGGVASDPEGKPLCFAFNSAEGCKEAAAGARCKRGWHLCAKCFQTHAIHEHEMQ